MRSSSGEDGLLAEWLSDVVVIPTPKTIHGNAAGGDWNGSVARANSEKGEGCPFNGSLCWKRLRAEIR